MLMQILRDLRQARKPDSSAAISVAAGSGADLYIELLKRCVCNSIYDDDHDLSKGARALDPASGKTVAIDAPPADPKMKYFGGIWPSRAHTMVGIPRLDNLQYCVQTVLRERVEGDLIETGVWRGGASIFMRGILKAHGVTDRNIWVADSFEGLPVPDAASYPKEPLTEFHNVGDLAVSLEQVQGNFARYELLDDQVKFLKGWFRDTLPVAPIERLAVMRLDGDMYESTMDALVNLYDKLSPGGYVILDDFNHVQSCNDAVADFRSERKISEEVVPIHGWGGFWRKA
jgi:O-methyltransferase